jgi:TonB-dependent starch-binding outer membrane protein SusC
VVRKFFYFLIQFISSFILVLLFDLYYEINPQDIESINILKNASAAAVYGSSAAAGVIEITTYKGTSDKSIINVYISVGWSEVGIHQRPYSPEGYLDMRKNHNIVNYGDAKPKDYFTHPDELPSDMTVQEWIDMDLAAEGSPEKIWANRLGLTAIEIKNFLEGNTINWYDQIFHRGLRQNYNVSVSGKKEDLSYYTSMQYIDNKHMIIDDHYKTLRGRVNLDYNIADFISVGMNTQFDNTNNGFLSPSLTQTIRCTPYGDKYDEDGILTQSPNNDIQAMLNPFLYTYEDYNSNDRNLRANIYGKLNLPAGFAIETRWVNRFSFGNNYRYTPSTHPNAEAANGRGSRTETTSWSWNVDNLLTWNDIIRDIHRFDFTFLWNVEKNQYWSTTTENENFIPNEVLTYHQIASGLSPKVGSNDYVNTGNALMGRLNYGLLDRYLLTFSIRRDGYSAFGEENPYALFPAASVGWRISEENFFNSNIVNNLKLRFSYGVNGNSSIGGYSALAALNTTYYIFGDKSYTGVYPSWIFQSY